MERKIKEGMIKYKDKNNGIFFKVRSLWDAKPKEFFPSNEFFYLDTNSLETLKPGQGAALYKLQGKLVRERVKRTGPEPEYLGLY